MKIHFAIIADIMAGFNGPSKAISVEPNRERAIRKAIIEAEAGDIILIAGKGHEKTQHTAEGIFPFSDVEVAKHALFDKMNEVSRKLVHGHSRRLIKSGMRRVNGGD